MWGLFPRFTPVVSNVFTREVAETLVRILQWVMTVEALIRGVDYVSGDGPNVTKSLTVIEASAPLWFWGGLALGVGSLMAIGIVWRRYEPMIAGATLGAALYVTFAIGMGVTVYQRGWPPDGYRTPAMFLLYAVVWLMISVELFVTRDAVRSALEGGSDADTGSDR